MKLLLLLPPVSSFSREISMWHTKPGKNNEYWNTTKRYASLLVSSRAAPSMAGGVTAQRTGSWLAFSARPRTRRLYWPRLRAVICIDIYVFGIDSAVTRPGAYPNTVGLWKELYLNFPRSKGHKKKITFEIMMKIRPKSLKWFGGFGSNERFKSPFFLQVILHA